MLVTKAEASAIFEALRSVLGSMRAKDFFLEGCHEVHDLPLEANLIGKAHGPPVARPRSVEPETPGSPLGLHTGVEGREA